MSKNIKSRFVAIIMKAGKNGISIHQLARLLRLKPNSYVFANSISELVQKKTIIKKGDTVIHSSCIHTYKAVITRLNSTFGFAKTEDDVEYFIPGRFFLGALPGDTVMLSPIKARGDGPEAEVVSIVSEGNATFIGTVVEGGIKPDSLINAVLPISIANLNSARISDKVQVKVVKRGARHSEHIITVIANYGDSNSACCCTNALLDNACITSEFNADVINQATNFQKPITDTELSKREDFRSNIIFTIDSAYSKDLDDAVSLEKYGDDYHLGVHIADVAHYVTANSPLDKEAFKRGTSLYFADRVIPMLPVQLSNDVCSLNPNEDKLTFSALLTISSKGELLDFDFKKSVINSSIKGVYSEINDLILCKSKSKYYRKYKSVYPTITLMNELADILTNAKNQRGAPQIDTIEAQIILDDNGKAIDVMPRERGKSEIIIEEFMLMANQAAAMAARLKELPFVYRIHEPPSTQKVESLNEVLIKLGLPQIEEDGIVQPSTLSKLIEVSKGQTYSPIINKLVLRTMSKARYSEEAIGHYGLVLKDYAHFTSPIRRYPDLSIHRILSETVKGSPIKKIRQQYSEFAKLSAAASSELELSAMKLERQCDDCYKAEYMLSKVGETYTGVISGIAPHGIYVMLENSVEGLVRLDSLPEGQYEVDDPISVKELLGGKEYRLGDCIEVTCTKADVSNGNVDFVVKV